ncbi:MAG: hypothetical protein KDB16_16370, partial [Acidimicrobiales bacterium]|nr:hypothetical protein [Acidimicrobiales bacterium]
FGGDGPVPAPYCSFVRVEDTATVSWTADDSTHVIRRDGAWLATPPDDVTSYTDADSPPGTSYAVRAWVEGIRVEHQCVQQQPDAEAPWCSVENVGGTAVLTWTDDGGRHVVRRDGSWLATPGQGESTFIDTAPHPDALYVIRTWNDGQTTDRTCEGV